MRLGFPFLLLSLRLSLRSLFLCCALTDPFGTVSPFYSHLSLVSSVLLSNCSTRRGNEGRRKKGGREDSLLCIRRQWHGPPHSSYLHSFNATWGLWNVQQPRGLRRAGPTVPLIPIPRMIVRWHSSLLQTLSLFRGKLSQSSIQIRLDTSRTCRVNLDISFLLSLNSWNTEIRLGFHSRKHFAFTYNSKNE